MTKDALVPPKPKEFESTFFIFLFFDLFGTKSKPNESLSGLTKLFVGGAV